MPSLSDIANFGVPIATNVISGLAGRRAAGQATNTLATGGQQAIDTIQGGQQRAQGTLNNVWDQQQHILDPYRTAGQHANDTLAEGSAPGGNLVTPFSWVPADLQNDPIFQRRLKMGQDAIAAAGNAGGTRFTGASMKDFADYSTGAANDYLAQDYSRQENTFRQNQRTQLDALNDVANRGLSAAGSEVSAGTGYGTNTANLETGTAKAVADLQTDIASAQAAGDVAKANQLQGMLDGITSGIQQASVIKSLATKAPIPGVRPQPGMPGFVGPVNQAAGGVGASLASSAPDIAAVPGITGGVAATAAPAFAMPAVAPLGMTGALAAPEIAAPSLAAGAGGTGGGLGASMGAFLTNPVTIGIGVALAGALLWHKSQVHQTADTFVKNYQDKFANDKGTGVLNRVVNEFDRALATGQLSKADAQAARDQTAELIGQFTNNTDTFSTNGGKEKRVAEQSKQRMAQLFGPNYEAILGKMDQEIARLG